MDDACIYALNDDVAKLSYLGLMACDPLVRLRTI